MSNRRRLCSMSIKVCTPVTGICFDGSMQRSHRKHRHTLIEFYGVTGTREALVSQRHVNLENSLYSFIRLFCSIDPSNFIDETFQRLANARWVIATCCSFHPSNQEIPVSNPVLVNQIIPASDIVPLTGRIGAEIRNIRLGGDLSDATVASINRLLLKHKVIFFRGQQHLDDSEQELFARRLGDLVPHPTQGPVAGTASILNLDSSRGGGRADQWHTDVTFVDAYPKFSVLRGVVIPAAGGDTIWSNTHAAYENLPAPLRLLADNLWAIHSNAYDYAAVRPRATAEEKKHFEEIFTSTIYETEHPVVRPSGNRRALAAARQFRPAPCRLVEERFHQTLRSAPVLCCRPGKHRTMALADRRRRHLGQPCHPALCGQRLWRPAPGRAPRDGGR